MCVQLQRQTLEHQTLFIDSGNGAEINCLKGGVLGGRAALSWHSRSTLPTTRQELEAVSRPGEVLAMKYGHDGELLVVYRSETGMLVWNWDRHKEVRALSCDESINSLVFNHQATLIAAATSSGVKIWSVTSEREDGELPVGTTVKIALFPDQTDETIILVAEAEVLVWDILNSMAFAPDGKRLAIASQDGTIRIVIIDSMDIVREASRRMIRKLSPEEWKRYLEDEPYPTSVSD